MTTAFAVCAVLAVILAVAALFSTTLYGSAMCLLGVLLETAALFVLVGAPLLGFLQVLVYAGAVMVLIVIAILSSPPRLSQRWAEPAPGWLDWLAPAAALGALLACGPLLRLSPLPVPYAGPALEKEMARLLFGPWAVALEAVGVLVLVASLSVLKEDA